MKAILAAMAMAVAMTGGVVAVEPAAPAVSPVPVVSGPVLESTNVARYTYVRVNAGDKEIWAAGPETAVAVGERVKLELQIPMKDFWSAGLNRRFPLIYFVSAIEVEGRPETAAPRAAPHGKMPQDAVHQGKGGALPEGHPDIGGMAKTLPAGLPAGHPDIGGKAKPAPEADADADAEVMQVGKVLQTVEAGRYTYIEVQQGKTKRWLAAPKIALKVGEQIRYPEGLEMKEFKSDTLKRTFASIVFVEGVFPGAE